MAFSRKEQASPKGAERYYMFVFGTMEEIRKNAIRVNDGTCVFWPQSGEFTTIHLHNLVIEPNKMLYSYKNGVVAFITQQGYLYAIPDIKGVQDTLKKSGYKKGYFYVPFSNWDIPFDNKEHWEELWKIKNNKQA